MPRVPKLDLGKLIVGRNV